MAVEPEQVVVELVAVEEPEQAVAVALAGDQPAAEPVVAAVQEEPAVVPVEEVEQEPGRVVVMGLELVLVRLQGQALDRVQEPRSVLALALQSARVRLAAPGLVQVPVHRSAQGPTRPSVLALAVLSGMEPVMDPLMELGTRASGLKTEPVLERQNNVVNQPSFEISTGTGLSISNCPSFFVYFHSSAVMILIAIARHRAPVILFGYQKYNVVSSNTDQMN